MNKEKRLELHYKLIDILGSQNVYFQPPPSKKMEYPCIVYSLIAPQLTHADNKNYFKHDAYSIVYMGKNIESETPDRIEELEYCTAERPYSKDNLHYFPFRIYL